MLVKWASFLVELYALFVFVNTALLVPYSWDIERSLFLVGAAVLGGICAFFSGLKFMPLIAWKSSAKSTLLTFPCVLWFGIVLPTALLLIVSRVRP